MATVEIIIKGIAICYRGASDGMWHVLFPIDAERCHKINFSFKKEDDPYSIPVALAGSSGITITASGTTEPISESDMFKYRVLNLTSTTTAPITHPRIRKKGPLSGKAVLLTIPHARFTVDKYLEEFPPSRIPPLTELPSTGTTPHLFPSLAHSVKATITLGSRGQVIVTSGISGGSLTTDEGASYKILFDNDCEVPKAGRNDMDMFYDIIEEFDDMGASVNRRFRIGGHGKTGTPLDKKAIEELKQFEFDKKTIERLGELGIDKETILRLIELGIDKKPIKELVKSDLDKETIQRVFDVIIMSEPPNYVEGKPCLVVKATEPGDLP